MPSQPVRVPHNVYEELQNAARLMDCTPGELLDRAWSSYRQTPEFTEDFTAFQKAFAKGDIDAVSDIDAVTDVCGPQTQSAQRVAQRKVEPHAPAEGMAERGDRRVAHRSGAVDLEFRGTVPTAVGPDPQRDRRPRRTVSARRVAR